MKSRRNLLLLAVSVAIVMIACSKDGKSTVIPGGAFGSSDGSQIYEPTTIALPPRNPNYTPTPGAPSPTTDACYLLEDKKTTPVSATMTVSSTVSEGAGRVPILVSLSEPVGRAIQLFISVVPVSGTARPDDFTQRQQTILFPCGTTQALPQIVLADDETREDNETFELEIHSAVAPADGSGQFVTLPPKATVTILDNDGPGGVRNGRIAYVERGVGDRSQIFSINPDGRSKVQFTQPDNNIQPDWSPDGTKIYFASGDIGSWELYSMSANGGNFRPVLRDPATGADRDPDDGFDPTVGEQMGPAVSPDGTKLLFSSSSTGDHEIWMVELATGTVTQVTDNSKDDFDPTWAPDGAMLAFSRQGEIYTKDGPTVGAAERAIGLGSAPDWGRNAAAECIAFHNVGDIIVRCATPGSVIEVTGDEGYEYDAGWSPDGTELLFIGSLGDNVPDFDSDEFRLWRVSVDAQALTAGIQTPVSGVLAGFPSSPDWGTARL